MVATVSEAYADIVCNICRPPKIIAGPTVSSSTYNKTKVNRLIRNHMASHQLMNEYSDDCCAFCCKAGCKLSVALEGRDTMKICDFKPVTDPRYKAPAMVNCIITATVVCPNLSHTRPSNHSCTKFAMKGQENLLQQICLILAIGLFGRTLSVHIMRTNTKNSGMQIVQHLRDILGVNHKVLTLKKQWCWVSFLSMTTVKIPCLQHNFPVIFLL